MSYILHAGSSPDSVSRPEIVDNMVKTLQSKVAQTSEKVSVLQEFQLYVREGDSSYIKRNFKYVFISLHILCDSFNHPGNLTIF